MKRSLVKAMVLVAGASWTMLPAIARGADSPLLGRWQRTCWQGDLELQTVEVMAFTNSDVTVQRDFSVQDTCGHPDFGLTARARYVLQDAQPTASRIKTVDMTWTSVVLTPYHEEAAKAFNELAVCGLRDWQTQVAKNVSGLICQGLTAPKVGRTFFQIIKIDGDHFLTGDYSSPQYDASSAAKRPVALDPQGSHVKLPGTPQPGDE